MQLITVKIDKWRKDFLRKIGYKLWRIEESGSF